MTSPRQVPAEVPELEALDTTDVKQKLRWEEELDAATDLQKEFFWHLNSYRDVMLPQRTLTNADEFREMYVCDLASSLVVSLARAFLQLLQRTPERYTLRPLEFCALFLKMCAAHDWGKREREGRKEKRRHADCKVEAIRMSVACRLQPL